MYSNFRKLRNVVIFAKQHQESFFMLLGESTSSTTKVHLN